MGTPFSRFNSLMAAVAMSIIGATVTRDAAIEMNGGYKSRGKGKKNTTPAKRLGRSSGVRHPEQSARQKLRAYRRAQGGPGLTEGTPRPMARSTFNAIDYT